MRAGNELTTTGKIKSKLTKLSKFFYLNIQVHKNEKNTKQNHSAKQNF